MPPTRGASRTALVRASTIALAPAILLAACASSSTETRASRAAPGPGGSSRAAARQPGGGAAADTARAELHDAAGAGVGQVELASVDGGTRVTVEIDGLDAVPGFHGFHVHANDDPANGSGCVADPADPPDTWFTAVDGHLHAEGETHGDHRGDLPSLLVTDGGRAWASFVTDRVTVDDLEGKALVVHSNADNFGNVPVGEGDEDYRPNTPAATEATAATGNAGDRLACGIVTTSLPQTG
jgi:Cu-Zn family superoxide dismutase